MSNESPWILGLDLGPRSAGALRFARLLRQRLDARVVGVFVCEQRLLGAPPVADATLMVSLRADAARWFATLEVGAPDEAVDATRIDDASDAETGLTAAGHGSAGVIVGRHFASPGDPVRLGRVTRRLLRRLPAPVIVVPPELAEDEFDGPVLLATDLTERSAAAARFAVALAGRLGRRLVCVHVGQSRWDETFRPIELRVDELRRSYQDATDRSMRAWAAEHCPGAELKLEYGDPVDCLPAFATRQSAGLLVVGSGRPGLIERLFAGSTASTLAAVAPCAVAVVPMDAG